MKKIIVILILFIAGSHAYSQGKSHVVDSVITVKKGEKFNIIFSSNRSTGYSWHVINDYQNIISLEENEYKDSKDQKIGSAGEELWHFHAHSKGEGYLMFFYSRSIERKQEDSLVIYKVIVN